MKIIITESQNKSIKNNLNKVIDKSGISAGIKAVGGLDNFVKIMYDGAYSKFITLVVNELIDNTELRGHHYYLFDCNISVMLNHADPRKPFFAATPSCFDYIMDSNYGLKKVADSMPYDVKNNTINFIWGAYSEFIINTYLKNKEW
jgi:hypothetical protein